MRVQRAHSALLKAKLKHTGAREPTQELQMAFFVSRHGATKLGVDAAHQTRSTADRLPKRQLTRLNDVVPSKLNDCGYVSVHDHLTVRVELGAGRQLNGDVRWWRSGRHRRRRG